MERKVGEIFEYNGEWYQCMEGTGCYRCAFYDKNICIADNPHCTCRSDKKNVIFKKLEKVGEPMKIHDRLVLKVKTDAYKCMRCCFYSKGMCELTMEECAYYDCGEGIKFVEIKQNKENMEEEKLNLKKFDLQAAKAGKPVCTRDGRKARIICFDLNNKNFPIVAIINCDTEENAYQYDIDGVCDEHDNNLNLMMSPEKKEGWIIIHKEAIYDKETAEKIAKETTADVIRIQKIEWEE